MRTFYGGHIKDIHRGKYSLVVSNGNNKDYDVFLNPIHSDEFINLTGVRDSDSRNKRVYIGISLKAGQDVTKRLSGSEKSISSLEDTDEFLVLPFFLDRARGEESRKCRFGSIRVCQGD